MTSKPVTYDFPKGNPSPFNVEFEGHYFINANGLSNLSNSRQDFSLQSLESNVPMGYKTVIINRRLVLFGQGNLLKSWVERTTKNKKMSSLRYSLCLDQQLVSFGKDSLTMGGNTVFRERAGTNLEAALWSDINECEHYGRMVSKQWKCGAIISEVLETIHWH